MRVLDLFSGIGGFSLGLERAGMRTVAFCEIEPFCQAVLRKHWPNIHCYDDIRTLTAERLAEDGIGPVDVICGGFPCQDISVAGKGAGITGSRSGLWTEYARLIGELRPRYVIVENVAALLGRGLDRVLGDLTEIGYDAEWNIISAADVGAPHRRERVWIVAYPISRGRGKERLESGLGKILREWPDQRGAATESGKDVAYTGLQRSPRTGGNPQHESEVIKSGNGNSKEGRGDIPNTRIQGLERQRTFSSRIGEKLNDACDNSWWLSEPDVGRVANGVPARVDRLKGLGNAVVPQIPEIIGRAILAADSAAH